MARQLTYPEIVEAQMDRMTRLIRNLLIDNPNYKHREDGGFYGRMAYYFEAYPKSYELHSKVVKEHAEYILHEMDQLKELFVEMAKDED